MVGQVEVDRVRSVFVRLEIEIAAGTVGLGATGLVEERQEEGLGPAIIEHVRRELARSACQVEPEHAGAMSRAQAAVGRRDLEA